MKAFEIPEEPVKADYGGEGNTYYRYEDVAQDGRIRIEGIWPSMGRVLWGKLAIGKPLSRLGIQHGIRSVLTRVIMLGGSDPISAREPATTRVKYRLEHEPGADGKVQRLLFNTWLSTEAGQRESANPIAPGTGEKVVSARAYGQHVFTKPTQRPPNHRVLELPDPDLPSVPPHQGRWMPPEQLLDLPDGAATLDERPRLDPAPIVFGLAHTDGNQHVNFLTYPRLVEDAALRRLVEFDGARKLLARKAELGYRKPCFAGDRMRIVSQAFRLGDGVGVVAGFYRDQGDGDPESWDELGRPHCTARLLLTE